MRPRSFAQLAMRAAATVMSIVLGSGIVKPSKVKFAASVPVASGIPVVAEATPDRKPSRAQQIRKPQYQDINDRMRVGPEFIIHYLPVLRLAGPQGFNSL